MSASDLMFLIDGATPTATSEIPIATIPAGGADELTPGDTISLVVTNLGSTELTGVGLWIQPATLTGDESIRNYSSVETDFVSVVAIGDAALEDYGPLVINDADSLSGDYVAGGLWCRPSDGTIWYRVCSLRGVSKATRIGNATIAPASSYGWEIFLEPPTGATAVRYFFDIMVEDAS
jgi:hypothetical protein